MQSELCSGCRNRTVTESVWSSSQCWFLSHCFIQAHARLSGGGVGVRWHAVLSEDRFELLQRGVGSNPRRVEVSPTHPEAGLCQVLKELVQPVQRSRKTK